MDFDTILQVIVVISIVGLILFGAYYFIYNREWLSTNEASLTILLLIIGIIIAILSSYLGAVVGAKAQAKFAYDQELQKSDIHDETVARLLYLDLIYLTSTVDRQYNGINCLDKRIKQNPNTRLRIIGTIYPDNALWYSYRPEIAWLNLSISNNLTRFYNDMMYAEIYKNEIDSAISQQDQQAYDIAYGMFSLHIRDAHELHSNLISELKQQYNITEDIPYSIYQYKSMDPCL